VKLANWAALAGVAVTVLLFSPSAATGDEGLTLRGYGTATVDGVLGLNEWDRAGRYDFMAKRAPAEVGGTVPATFYVMNDSENLYLALRVAVSNVGYSTFTAVFSAPGPSPFGEGNDILWASPSSFEDYHYHETAPNNWEWVADVADGGSRDGSSAFQGNADVSFFEMSHPLNTADDHHDFSLTIPKHVTFFADFQHCRDSCVGTFMPSSGFGEIVVVSGTLVPPQTAITAGPTNGAQVRDERTFEFTGNDDVTPPDQLEFQCKVDAEEWSACESPFSGGIEDGWHTLSVRALDDMLNADPTPATRRWRIDTKAPSKPSVAGPRLARTDSPQYRFSSSDPGTPRRRIRFRCAFDTKRLHACRPAYRRHLPQGRHVLRVRAVDPAGNESGTTTVRIVLRASA
jgi:hypothetical protein